tara:strand:- start:334 stop:1473 length:1140 start_codon:yes stop_codon:yes gene_type:complete
LNLIDNFLLDKKNIHLNHGSFGACLKIAYENQQYWQRELESNPTEFIVNTLPNQLRTARFELGKFIGCAGDSICFFQNPTTAINTVARGLNLGPGDEVLGTDHEYGAMEKLWGYITEKTGSEYVRAKIPIPIKSKNNFLESFASYISPRTRVVFISQITSASALVLPVKEIIDFCKERDIVTIVDGAHVPGHVDLDISDLDPDYYTGACHKWMCTPKGVSFLYVNKKYHNSIEPFIVSWGYKSDTPGVSRFLDYMEVQGTRDPSAFLTVPTVIDFFDENRWDIIREKSRALVQESIARIHNAIGSEPLMPDGDSWMCQMACAEIRTEFPSQLQGTLFEKYNIVVPITNIGDRYFIRISINAYNSSDDIDMLLEALRYEL